MNLGEELDLLANAGINYLLYELLLINILF